AENVAASRARYSGTLARDDAASRAAGRPAPGGGAGPAVAAGRVLRRRLRADRRARGLVGQPRKPARPLRVRAARPGDRGGAHRPGRPLLRRARSGAPFPAAAVERAHGARPRALRPAASPLPRPHAALVRGAAGGGGGALPAGGAPFALAARLFDLLPRRRTRALRHLHRRAQRRRRLRAGLAGARGPPALAHPRLAPGGLAGAAARRAGPRRRRDGPRGARLPRRLGALRTPARLAARAGADDAPGRRLSRHLSPDGRRRAPLG